MIEKSSVQARFRSLTKGLSLAVVLSGVFIVMLPSQAFAIPNISGVKPVIINEDSEDLKLTIPWDSSKLLEPSIDPLLYSNFVQSDSAPLSHLTTEKINSFSTGYGFALNKGHIEFADGYSIGVIVYAKPGPNITLVTVYKDNRVVTNAWITTRGMQTIATPNMAGSRADQIVRVGDKNSFEFQLLISDKVRTYQLDISGSKPEIKALNNLALDVPKDVPPADHISRPIDYPGRVSFWNRPWSQSNGITYLGLQYSVWELGVRSSPTIFRYQDGVYKDSVVLQVPSPSLLYVSRDPVDPYLMIVENIMALGSDSEKPDGYAGVITVPKQNEQLRHLTYWDSTGVAKIYKHPDNLREVPKTDFIDSLNSTATDGVYAKVVFSDRTQLVKVTPAGEFEVIKEFPVNTDVAIRKFDERPGYVMSGVISDFTGEFAKYQPADYEPGKNYLFTSEMDDQFELSKWTLVALNNADISVSDLVYVKEDAKPAGLDDYVLVGRVNSASPDFTDDYYEYGGITGQHNGDVNSPENFVLKFSEQWDYPPIISKLNPLILNIDKATNQVSLDSQMLKDVQAFDLFDITNKIFQPKELLARLNRNYKAGSSTPIDWKGLGFDGNIIGPQLITYFISDSLPSMTATSRWVNNVNKFVGISTDESAFMYGKNFSIPFEKAKTLDLTTIRLKADTKAWLNNLSKDKETLDNPYTENIEMDPNNTSDFISVNDFQLEAINVAKVPGPLPLQIFNRETQVATRRIWVFTTDKNTTIDEENDAIVYAKDIDIDYEKVMDLDELSIIKEADIRVYQYNSFERTAKLSPLATSEDNKGLSITAEDIERIKAVSPAGDVIKDVKIHYKQRSGQTTSKINVNVEGSNKTVHVNFVNENNEAIHEEVTLVNNQIQAVLHLDKIESITQAIKDVLDTKDYIKYEFPDNEYEVKRETNNVTYIFRGLLKFSEITPNLTFEKGSILTTNQTLSYGNQTSDFVVEVQDFRKYGTSQKLVDDSTELGIRGNFKVSAVLSSEFKHVKTDKKLENVALTYNTLDITTESATLINSTADKDNLEKKTFKFTLDQVKKKNKKEQGWNLIVPPHGVKKGKYTAEVTWTLEATP